MVSPGRVPLPDQQLWGFSAQLYAARSASSWGIGDLGDLRRLGAWSAGLGARVALVNPLHAVARPCLSSASPYFPGSRCFMNPIYLAVEKVPGADSADLADLGAAARALNDERLIDRDRVWELKSSALEAIFAGLGEVADLEKFRADRGEALERFATFCALAELHGPRWRAWPQEYRRSASEHVRRFSRSRPGSDRVRYYAWLQRLLELQAQDGCHPGRRAARPGGRGRSRWGGRLDLAGGLRGRDDVGAPPDVFNTRGQDWALPPFDPWRLRGRV